MNLLVAYCFFYNPLRFVKALVLPKSRLYLADAAAQILGMFGLIQTIRRTVPWLLRLWRGRIVRSAEPPTSPIPMVRLNGCAQPGDGRGLDGGRAPTGAKALGS